MSSLIKIYAVFNLAIFVSGTKVYKNEEVSLKL